VGVGAVVGQGLAGPVAGDQDAAAADAEGGLLESYDRLVPAADLADTLGRAINDVNNALRRRTREEPELAGMGTTAVAVLMSGDTAVLANVGDSRAYLMRDFRASHSPMVQVSEDHTYKHLVADAGEVPNLPEKLARFLDGRKDGRSPDLTMLRLRPGDRLLLCSDGLSSFVPHQLIRSALNSMDSPAQVVDTLVGSALDHGGRDNVTVMIIDIID
jgi:serine/threonine protein phosphatase PrpC